MGGVRVSQYRGVVSRKSDKWGAQISVEGKQKWLGTYATEIEAAVAYDRAALKLSRFCYLNFPMYFRNSVELEFQNMFSLETIITMISSGHYCGHFSNFMANKTDLSINQRQPTSRDTRFDGIPEGHHPVMLFGTRIA